jgi:protein SCO1/2
MRATMRVTILAMFAFLALLAACKQAPNPELEPLHIGGELELKDAAGNIFRLADHGGEIKILFFGYASCPDACPMALSRVASVAKALGEGNRDLLTIFVSVDPGRDTPELLDEFLGFFGVRGVGLTGPKERIDEVVKSYGAQYEMFESGSAGDYLVSHSTYLYLLDRENRVRRIIGTEDSTEAIAGWVTSLLSER